jgi:methyltransferase (TIGR00027 family)
VTSAAPRQPASGHVTGNSEVVPDLFQPEKFGPVPTWTVSTEKGCIFNDPLALRILGEDAETVAREAEERPSRRRMRIFIAVRTRFAEDALAASVEQGVCQVVVLGAGLDTYRYRTTLRDRLRIFEVEK